MLTPNVDGLLPCFACREEGKSSYGLPVPVTAVERYYRCAVCRVAGRVGLDAPAKEAWNRIQRALDWQSKLNESVTMEMIQRALEALDDAERSADLEERKLQAFENLMDHPEWGPGR